MLIGAYYYIWYGSPIVPIVGGGDWERSGSTNTPVLGRYNSRDEAVISKHFDWAKEAGIDFFAISWSNVGSWDDESLKNYYLKKSAGSGVKFCIFYDSIPALNRHRFNAYSNYDFNESFSPNKTKGEKFVEDFEYLAENYFNRPDYLKINGRPVVIIYNASGFKNIQSYFDKIKENMAKRGISLFLIADAVCWPGIKITRNNLGFLWENSPKEAFKVILRALGRLTFNNLKEISFEQYFDAITGYNMYAVNRADNFLNNIDDLYKKFYSYAKSQKVRFVPNVMPGYDDRQLMGLENPVLKREEGSFYKNFWKVAVKYLDPDIKMALITTFNEWHEGTEIEPSKEHQSRYLEATKEFKNNS
ncbi:MAG: glycoside hydrolase family 99-like domain-containing protein [bacterium]|nr:glycoside hydrolase family 99-like domain-containing protein [bacterium]